MAFALPCTWCWDGEWETQTLCNEALVVYWSKFAIEKLEQTCIMLRTARKVYCFGGVPDV